MDSVIETVRLLMQRAEAGRLIGDKGQTVQEIRRTYDVKIFIDQDTSSQRVVTVTGERHLVIKAMDTIAETLQDQKGAMCNKSLQLLIPDVLCRNLVGNGGENLQKVCREPGIKLSVEPIPLPGSTERTVQLSEGRGSLAEGIASVLDFMKIKPMNSTTVNTKFQPMKDSTRKTSKASESKTLSFKIKNGHIWKLMQGKDHISDLRKRLGVSITVASDELITVIGPLGAIKMCQTILKKNNSEHRVPEEDKKHQECSLKVNCMDQPEFKATATLLSMTRNAPKDE